MSNTEHPVRRSPARARHSGGPPHRARSTAGALWMTLVGTVVPGAGYLLAGRRRLGAFVMTVVAALAGAAVTVAVTRRDEVLRLALDPQRLLVAAVVLGAAGMAWIVVIVSTHRMLRPATGGPAGRVAGSMFTGVLCFAVAAPMAYAAQTALTQRSLIESIFGPRRRARPGRRWTRRTRGRTSRGSTSCCSEPTTAPGATASAPTP